MTRYLTPWRISLLCLITVYTDGLVPNSSAIDVLSFLTAGLFPLDPADKQWEKHYLPRITEIEEVLSGHESSVPGRSLWDLFLKKIWSLDSLDALEVFFNDEIPSLLTKTREQLIQDRDHGLAPENEGMRLSRSSPLGAFVRRAYLEYTRLQFHDSVTLWTGFVKYRLPTYNMWARRNASDKQDPVDINLNVHGFNSSAYLSHVVYGSIEDDEEDEGVVSVKDAERLIEFQVGELQRLGGRVPEEMRAQLKRIITSDSNAPVLMYYLEYLDAWRAGDYTSAFDNLHRYFDYTMHSNSDRSAYQFSLLNLAIIQADFECFSEAISAVQEAVAIARESHDMNCLNFCMSWLYHFGKAFPEQMREVQNSGMLGNEKEGLMFLKAKAKDAEMWSLMSTTILSEAKLEMQQGESLATIVESFVRASHINVTKGLSNPTGAYILLQSAMYARIGATHLAWLDTEVFRECYMEGHPYEEFVKLTFRNCQILAQKGNYKEAFARMNKVEPERLRAFKYNNSWTYYSGLLQLRRQINRDDKVAVEHILAQLQAIQLLDFDMRLLLAFHTIEFTLRQGDTGRALRMVEQAANTMQPENFDVHSQIKLLCLKARILEKSGHPQRGFSLAMRAASIAHRSKVLFDLWEAICTLAAVLLSLREFEATAELVESIMPQILEAEDSALTARAYSLLVDANMGIAGELSTSKQGGERTLARKEYVNRALGYIDSAYDAYEEIEDILGQTEMMAKKATVMHLTGDPVLANDYAAKYLDLRKRRGAEI
ncbi:uncharacterized protein N7473_009106 [Penicillium subrubescens]|uniref:Anaphase-promoting complex subunit 5 n=1 Tax=Penicillium subrubescens TaxID=1316194 RepID=A0A1Q5UGC1_9EURO|nr:uncharacterized protein N7473_009106 [Penicillium subrubescens]KAJ5886432.1 hypothetical protein N7473_009106 [Penicillium subrubescens]OKP11512.1 Anaphase-promoting complex subunit 5 [Penicillium subrubescens]